MKVTETVNYKIECDNYDMSVGGPNGSKSGIFNANEEYVIYCAALEPGQEKIVKITLWNNSGTKIIEYRCYNPNFYVNYKNDSKANISNIKCNLVFDNDDKKESTYKWTINSGKDKSDAWIDLEHNYIKKIIDVTIDGKIKKYDVTGLNTKEITIIIAS